VSRKARPPLLPKIITGLLAAAVIGAGFAMLIVRLEVTGEGYRLSAVKIQVRQLDDENQRLRLQEAQLESHQRLRALAVHYHMGPPAPGHVMVVR
jgi:cell division protein FtsL